MICRLFTSLLNVLYPPTCIICKTPCFNAHLLCGKCWSNITFITRAYCKKCGTSFLSNDRICLCTDECCVYENHVYHSTRPIVEYNSIAKDLIKGFKFHAKFEIMKLFRCWFNSMLKEYDYRDVDYIVPIPLYKKKLKKRGYNQTAILAKNISRIIKKKYHSKLLLKVKDTANQSDLKKEARERNLINAFEVYHENAHILKNKKILLIDDVITTGTTANECSKTLIKNGTDEVKVFSLARRLYSTPNKDEI